LFSALIEISDDTVSAANYSLVAKNLNNFSSAQFEIKDLGKLKNLLRHEHSRSPRGIVIVTSILLMSYKILGCLGAGQQINLLLT